jgi:hypothetical protein
MLLEMPVEHPIQGRQIKSFAYNALQMHITEQQKQSAK